MSDANFEFETALLPTASLHEAAGKRGALPSVIKPVDPAMRLAGPAFTVRTTPGDNLPIHHAMAAAKPGDILVVDALGGTEFGYWGEIMTVAAQTHQLGGLVINAGVRDRDALVRLGFPVFSNGICIRGTAKDPTAPSALNEPISLGDVTIRAGDLVVGDADGVVAIEQSRMSDVVAAAIVREDRETSLLEQVRAGAFPIDIM